jgi:putative transposase
VKQRHGSHTVYQLQVHVVFCTKYRYRVLRGEIQERCRDLIRQVCDRLDVRILKGVVSADHVQLHLSYRPQHALSEIVRRIKGRSARRLLEEYPTLKKRYWGGHFWGIGYGAWSTGEITEEIVNAYLEHHRHGDRPNDPGDFILE